MKKQFIALTVAATIILSGAAGFGGVFLAKFLFSATGVLGPAMPTVSEEQQYMPTDLFLTEYSDENDNSLNDSGATVFDSSSLISTNEKAPEEVLTIPEIAAFAADSVVEIYTETVVSSGRMGQFVNEGAGSGVIVSSDGYIVTNNHVIDGARKITVLLRNGNEYEAALIGRDSKTDLAAIKINTTGLQPVIYGNSDSLQIGELAVAIGNPLGQLGGSVTEGIISALSRNIDIDGEMMTLLQTSAAVNPGNSGGGLFNCHGELIGVVNAKSSGSDIEGIGFAIPVNTVKTIADDIIQYGYVPGRIAFGATLIDVTDSWTAMMYRVPTTGVYVSQADADSGLRPGDRIISIDGIEIKYSADVKELLDTYKVGETLSIIVSRNGQNTTVEHTLKQAAS